MHLNHIVCYTHGAPKELLAVSSYVAKISVPVLSDFELRLSDFSPLSRAPFGCFKKSQQIGQFLAAELFVQSARHDRDCSGAHFQNIGTSDAHFGIWAGGKDDFVGGFFSNQAVDLFIGFGAYDGGFVTADEAGAGINNRFEKIPLGARLADAGEVWSDLSAH